MSGRHLVIAGLALAMAASWADAIVAYSGDSYDGFAEPSAAHAPAAAHASLAETALASWKAGAN